MTSTIIPQVPQSSLETRESGVGTHRAGFSPLLADLHEEAEILTGAYGKISTCRRLTVIPYHLVCAYVVRVGRRTMGQSP